MNGKSRKIGDFMRGGRTSKSFPLSKSKRPGRDLNPSPGLSAKSFGGKTPFQRGFTTGPDDRPLHYRGTDGEKDNKILKFFFKIVSHHECPLVQISEFWRYPIPY